METLSLARYREFAPNNVVNCPAPSKYNVFAVPNVMPYCGDVDGCCRPHIRDHGGDDVGGSGLGRRIAICLHRDGIRPKTAIKQKAAIPRARVTSTRENAQLVRLFIVGKSLRCHQRQ